MSWLETELREQPQALARLLERQADAARTAAGVFGRGDIRYLLIASRGSSSNVARYAQYLLGRAHRVPVMFATPSLYTIYGQPPRLDGALVIGISQSGASPDVVAVLAEAREQGRPTLALTNDVESPLARTAEAVLPLEAGREQAVAATKTYVNSLGAVALLFAEMGDDAAAREELARMPEALAAQIELSLARDALARGVPRCGRADGRRARSQLRHRLRDRAQDPRVVGARHRGVLARRPDARPDRRDPAGLARRRRRAERACAAERRGDRAAAARPRCAARRGLGRPRGAAPRADEARARAGRPRVAEPADRRGARARWRPCASTSLRGLDLDSPVGLRKVTLTR